MATKTYARYAGILMFILGLSSLMPALQGSAVGLPNLHNEVNYGLYLGVFPENIFNKLALMIFGVAGFVCSLSGSVRAITNYCKVVAYVMGALAVLGIIPLTSTLGGMWPLFKGEIFAHGTFAIVAELCVLADAKKRRHQINYAADV